ncbi:MAG TPA: catalase [Acidobacteriaceae bacterium]
MSEQNGQTSGMQGNKGPGQVDAGASQPSSTLTLNNGRPIGDNQNSLTAGRRGPVLMEDYLLFEKMAQFNRERVPERVVHAKGSGAYGKFTVTGDISKYTSAKLFSAVGNTCETFLRFSTVGGEKGSADTARDPRGFAIKFYTEEGNWDLVGNNTPVFFIRDPLKFGDFIHTQKREPQTNLKSATMMWDFWSLSPEALHQITILFSDRGTPDGYRHMHGYGSHTFSLINADNELVYVKWHFRTKQGVRNLDTKKAEELAGSDPDYAQRDLFHAIEKGQFPQWTAYIQVMPEKQAHEFTAFNPFDLTKVWSQKEFPLIEVGELELNRNPLNYHADVEQAAFNPVNVVPGMGFSPDKMLQGRLVSYPDAHRYRIGTNYEALPVNAPKSGVRNYNRDGAMRFDGNFGALPNYEPNSFGGPKQDEAFKDRPLPIFGDVAARFNHREDNDDYKQAGDLFRLLDEGAKDRLCENIAMSLGQTPLRIQHLMLTHFMKADPDYAGRILQQLSVHEHPEFAHSSNEAEAAVHMPEK